MTCWLCKELSVTTCTNGPCKICVEVVKVDEEIDQALATLRRLHAKRNALCSEQNRAHDPIHRLPLELTSQIFELALPTQDGWGRTRRRNDRRPYFSSICKGWRDIAWSIPSLWSTIAIELKTSSTSDSSWLNSVYDWILRSRTLPLTLHIKVPNTRNDGSEDELKDKFEDELYHLLAVISKRPNEWQSLSLDIPSSFLQIFHNIYSDFLSHLLTVKKLRIRCTDDWDDANQVEHVLPSNPTINPEKIDIHGFPFQSLQISWNNLTYAKVEHWTLGEIRQLFQNAPQMTYCHIPHIHRLLNVAIPPIVHLRLQKLILGSGLEPEKGWFMILDSFTLPCLRVIQTNFLDAIKIPALVDRSSCPLTRITLRGCNGGMELLPRLRPFPGVTDLDLQGERVNYGVVEKFTFTSGYFPDLRHLTLPPPVFFGMWYAGTIPKLLGSRPDAPNEIPLRKILVRGVDKSHSSWNSEGWRQLEVFQSCIRWRGDGLEILIPA